MPNIIRLSDRKRERQASNTQIIEKVVNGEIIKCVNLDAMNPSQRSAYFAAADQEDIRK